MSIDLLTQIDELRERLFRETDGVVQGGLFEGLQLIEDVTWNARDLIPKLLGTYELELQLAISEFVRQPPDYVVNVGCAEGYYANGIGRLVPSAKIYASDIDVEALDICRRTAEANGIVDRIRLEPVLNEPSVVGLMQNADRPLLISDCEGCEQDMLLRADPTHFAKATLVVECHDFVSPGLSERMLAWISPTHECRLVFQGGRNPHGIAALGSVPEEIKWLAMSESRPSSMCWLVAVPRVTTSASTDAHTAALKEEDVEYRLSPDVNHWSDSVNTSQTRDQ